MSRKVGLAKRVKSNIFWSMSRKSEKRLGSEGLMAWGMSVTLLTYERMSGLEVNSGRWVMLPV